MAAGRWRCPTCGAMNVGDHQRCLACDADGSAARPNPAPRALANPSAPQPEAPPRTRQTTRCRSCGAGLPGPKAKFCPSCGTTVARPTPPPVPRQAPPPSPRCPSCRTVLPSANAKFCPSCGTTVRAQPPRPRRVCANRSCGRPLAEGAAFCPSCGHPTAAPKPKPRVCVNPSCGRSLPPGAGFCPHCGTDANQMPSGAPPRARTDRPRSSAGRDRTHDVVGDTRITDVDSTMERPAAREQRVSEPVPPRSDGVPTRAVVAASRPGRSSAPRAERASPSRQSQGLTGSP